MSACIMPSFSDQQLEYATAYIKSNNLQELFPRGYWTLVGEELSRRFGIAPEKGFVVKNRLVAFWVCELLYC
jgi:hypothetical protein